MKVLATDDQPIILKSIEHLLRSINFEVETAQNDEGTITKFESSNPDLIILDLVYIHQIGF
ncbi:MAG: DNA-binding response OmpR family regulator [Spirosomataceae bacterium]|jgi:DNA-binding response OmpR family regulator